MSVDIDEDRSSREVESTGDSGTLEAFAPLGNSFSLQLAAAGVLMVVAGYVIQTGVWAAILAVWGAALAVGGFAAYGFVTLSRRSTRG